MVITQSLFLTSKRWLDVDQSSRVGPRAFVRRSAARSAGRPRLLLFIAVGDARFYLGAFLVVVPGSDQQKRHWMAAVIIAPEDTQSIFESLATAAIHVPI